MRTQSRVPEIKQKEGEYVIRRGSSMQGGKGSSHLDGEEVARGRRGCCAPGCQGRDSASLPCVRASRRGQCAQQVATFIARQRAHAPTRPEPPQTPAHILKDENVCISKAAGLASVGKVQRRRYLPHEGRCEGLRTQSRVVMQAWGTICVGLNRPVGPRFSRAMAVEGDG